MVGLVLDRGSLPSPPTPPHPSASLSFFSSFTLHVSTANFPASLVKAMAFTGDIWTLRAETQGCRGGSAEHQVGPGRATWLTEAEARSLEERLPGQNLDGGHLNTCKDVATYSAAPRTVHASISHPHGSQLFHREPGPPRREASSCDQPTCHLPWGHCLAVCGKAAVQHGPSQAQEAWASHPQPT